MGEKIKGEDGNYYSVKSPFYKKWWFWLIVIIIIIIVFPKTDKNDKDISKENNSTSQTANKSSDSSKNQDKDKQSFYSIGETAVVGDAEYTLTSVELTDDRNQFEESEPAHVIKISYTVKNNGDSDLSIGMDVNVYDSQGKKMESYANENTIGSVASGKSIDAVKHYVLDTLGETEIHFEPIVSFGKDPAIFKVDIQ